jgi:5-methylcytosine-specific restriction endonuclease McrA
MTDEERAYGTHWRVWLTCALEVDHKTPLWKVAGLPDDERRWYFGPENLWLLCPRCHKAKTKREAAERAAQRRFAAAQLPLPL